MIAPSKWSASVTTLAPDPGSSSAFTTRFSPVLVFGIKLISDGLALMSAAKCDLTSVDRELLSGADIPPGRDRDSALRRIASAAATGRGCVYAPLMYVSPSGMAKSSFRGNASPGDPAFGDLE